MDVGLWTETICHSRISHHVSINKRKGERCILIIHQHLPDSWNIKNERTFKIIYHSGSEPWLQIKITWTVLKIDVWASPPEVQIQSGLSISKYAYSLVMKKFDFTTWGLKGWITAGWALLKVVGISGADSPRTLSPRKWAQRFPKGTQKGSCEGKGG